MKGKRTEVIGQLINRSFKTVGLPLLYVSENNKAIYYSNMDNGGPGIERTWLIHCCITTIGFMAAAMLRVSCSLGKSIMCGIEAMERFTSQCLTPL
jgi:hypothetical protein